MGRKLMATVLLNSHSSQKHPPHLGHGPSLLISEEDPALVIINSILAGKKLPDHM